MRSIITSAPSLIVKIVHDGESERTIGYASGLSYRVIQGQKSIYTVDSPFPAEIAQAAGASYVRGSMSIFLPKSSTPESLGLVAYRKDQNNDTYQAMSKYFNLRIYDRATSKMVVSLDFVKVGEYSVSVGARSIVKCDLGFEAILATPGVS